ncbi:hypothetical protein NDU88_005408 [Pleurodeles waltl]|uniref:Secreted protein n=1 Tax=Pleurodeles waltl TaxID=8319 RepID=A0AAV7UKY6_PLEWA|nr:hypothetical protein NDU88_005408 [Pleurodeles waltl]
MALAFLRSAAADSAPLCPARAGLAAANSLCTSQARHRQRQRIQDSVTSARTKNNPRAPSVATPWKQTKDDNDKRTHSVSLPPTDLGSHL